VKHCLAILLGVLTLTASGADWQKTLSPYQPGTFAPLRPLEAQYTFGWSALTAAQATFQLTRAPGDLYRVSLQTKTIGAVRPLWPMNADHSATTRAASFLPVLMLQKEVYRKQTRNTRLEFTPESVSRTRETIEGGKRNKETKVFKFPQLLDLHSALHYIRSQPLRTGDVQKLVVYPSTSPYLAQVKVLGRERLKVAGKTYSAIKSDLKLWRIDDDDLELKPHTKFKRATVWISDDSDRILLRIEAEIMVGSVWAELEKVQFAE
jgi:hypothetical protein